MDLLHIAVVDLADLTPFLFQWMIAEILGTSFGTLFGGMAYDAMGFENGLLVVAGIQVC